MKRPSGVLEEYLGLQALPGSSKAFTIKGFVLVSHSVV